jgi:hypothetical protein
MQWLHFNFQQQICLTKMSQIYFLCIQHWKVITMYFGPTKKQATFYYFLYKEKDAWLSLIIDTNDYLNYM